MSAPLKILVIRLSSLGDILHALPAFASLRASFPDAKIDWLVGKPAAFLLSAVRGIDSVHIFDKDGLMPEPFSRGAGKPGGARIPAWTLIRTLRSQRYDYCIDFQGLLKTAFLGLLSGAATRIGFPKDLVREPPAHHLYHRKPARPDTALHVIDLNRSLTTCIGADSASVPFDLHVPEEDARAIDALLAQADLKEFAVLNPGGGWPSKIWPPEKYGELADRIHDELDLGTIVTTGPGEESMYAALSASCRAAAPAHIQVSFLRMVPLLRRARLLVGGDTGPLHLACALKTPVVGIYGPTCPVRNGPWGKDDEVVHHILECSRCYKRSCPTGNACMDIAVDEVFAAVKRRMDKIVGKENPGGRPE